MIPPGKSIIKKVLATVDDEFSHNFPCRHARFAAAIPTAVIRAPSSAPLCSGCRQWFGSADSSAAAMQNDAGEMVDLYIPRKCSATNRLIGAGDHASVQFNVGHVSEDG